MSLIEVEFKGRRKGVFLNDQEFPLQEQDKVVVKADRGEDLGAISLIGPGWQERLATGRELEEFEPVLRKAGKEDIDTDDGNRAAEQEARGLFLNLVKKHELEMKLVDAEYQLDRKKLTFYFTAEGRVDFRALVKDLAHQFRTRIDLRQIGARDEAKRLGGMGLCGRELCCSSWIRDFQPVTTAMVKEQFLLLNPQKNTGLCGRLRCCLRYEVEQYREINRIFPKLEMKVKGPRGDGVVEKIDLCSASCGIRWHDGTSFAYTADQLKKHSDWDAEAEPQKSILTFKKDPSQVIMESTLVASSEPVAHSKPKQPPRKQKPVQERSKPVSSKPAKHRKERSLPEPPMPVIPDVPVPFSSGTVVMEPAKPPSRKPASRGPKGKHRDHEKRSMPRSGRDKARPDNHQPRRERSTQPEYGQGKSAETHGQPRQSRANNDVRPVIQPARGARRGIPARAQLDFNGSSNSDSYHSGKGERRQSSGSGKRHPHSGKGHPQKGNDQAQHAQGTGQDTKQAKPDATDNDTTKNNDATVKGNQGRHQRSHRPPSRHAKRKHRR